MFLSLGGLASGPYFFHAMSRSVLVGYSVFTSKQPKLMCILLLSERRSRGGICRPVISRLRLEECVRHSSNVREISDEKLRKHPVVQNTITAYQINFPPTRTTRRAYSP